MTNWEREFIGYFLGEGCITIQKCNQSKARPYYRIKLQFSARQDDDAILWEAKEKFGGYIYRYGERVQKLTGYKAKPVTTWVLDDEWRCEKVLKLIARGVLPSRKHEQVLLTKKFFKIKRKLRDKDGKLRRGRGWTYTPDDLLQFEQIKNQLHELKHFKVK